MAPRKDTQAVLQYAAQIPGTDPVAIEHALQMHHLMRQSDQDFDRYIQRDGLSASRFRVLHALRFAEHYTLTPAELAERVYLTRGAVTTALDGLEKMGYLTRGPHEADRRMIAVRLTDSGLALTQEMFPKHLLALSNIIGSVRREDMETVVSVFEKIADGIKQLLGESA